MNDIFLSYANEDIEYAEKFATLFSAQGLKVWWDHSIPPGKTWAKHIEEKIKDSKTVVVLWSNNSTESNWVNAEANYGFENNILFPVLIDDARGVTLFGENIKNKEKNYEVT